MPEGPEIRKAADKIAKAIVGKKVIQLRFGQPHLNKWNETFTNRQVESIKTYGKAMVTRFVDTSSTPEDSALNIYSHNQLYGRWVICEPEKIPPSTRQLRLSIHTEDKWALLYSASDIMVLDDTQVLEHPFIKKLGKDVLDPETKSNHITEKLLSAAYKNRQIGCFLIDQSFVAGLGNYLRCDILFTMGIHPTTKPAQLSKTSIKLLAEEILRMPRQSYQTASITNDLEAVKKLMAKGKSLEDSRFWVFHREGLPCYRCGTSIVKKSIGGQVCYLCEKCQKQ